MISKKYRYLLFGISSVILIAIIWYAKPAELISLLGKSDLKYVFLALLVSSFSMCIRVLKWKVLLNEVGFRELFPIQLLGITISNFTPGKIGEPSKALLLKMKRGIAVSKSLPTIIWERIIDISILIIFSIAAIQLLSVESRFFLFSFISLGIFISFISGLLIILYNKRVGIKFFNFLKRFPVLNKISENFIETFYKSKIKKTSLIFSFLLTIIPWLLEGFVFYFSFLALGVETSPFILTGMVALSVLIGVVSSLPGGLGSTEAVMIILLGMINISGALAIAGIFLYRFVSFWYGTFVGGLSFIYLSRRLDIKKII